MFAAVTVHYGKDKNIFLLEERCSSCSSSGAIATIMILKRLVTQYQLVSGSKLGKCLSPLKLSVLLIKLCTIPAPWGSTAQDRENIERLLSESWESYCGRLARVFTVNVPAMVI